MEGNSDIRSVLGAYSIDSLSSILISLKSQSDNFNCKTYQVSIKELYRILQSSSSKMLLNPEMEENLKEIMKELEKIIISDDLSPEFGLISASCIILIISTISQDPVHCFNQILSHNCLEKSEQNNEGEDNSLCDTEPVHDVSRSSARDVKCLENHLKAFTDSKRCYHNLIFIHGILNAKPPWIFYFQKSLGFKDQFQVDLSWSKFMQVLNTCLFGEILPFIHSYCTNSSNYSQQAIQVLYLWLQLFGQLIKGELKMKLNTEMKRCNSKTDFSNGSVEETLDQIYSLGKGVQDQTNDESFSTFQHFENKLKNCVLCSDIVMSHWFSLNEDNFGEIVQALNFVFENQNKGAVGLMLQCYKEQLRLHDAFLPNHSIWSMHKILKTAINSGMLTSRGSYLHLQMAFEILSPQEVLCSHPSIPEKLCLGLKTNQFAPLATSICRFLASKLNTQEWLVHFESIHHYCVATEDQALWQNYKTLWLPIIVSHHPQSIKRLLRLSHSGPHEWEARVTLLRLCRSKGIMNITDCRKETYKLSHLPNDVYSSSLDNFGGVFSFSYTDVEDRSESDYIKSTLLNGLVHVDDAIRAEAFAMLCLTQKTSLPLSDIEVTLLKFFLNHNMNTDSQSFRQSIVRSFQSLVCRIRDSCYKEVKKILSCNNDYRIAFLVQSLSEEALISFDFLIWLVHKINKDLSPLGNYSRHSAALSFYWVLLHSFLDNSKVSQREADRKQENRYLTTLHFIHTLSTLRTSDESEFVYIDLTCSETINILLSCCAYEMNDIGERAGELLVLLEKLRKTFTVTPNENKKKIAEFNPLSESTSFAGNEQWDPCTKRQNNVTFIKEWFRLALSLVDSPKASEMEGGATLVKTLLDTTDDLTIFLHFIRKEWDEERTLPSSTNAFEEILNSFMLKMEGQFEVAQRNILSSSYSGTISGSILALTICLTECRERPCTTLRPSVVLEMLSNLSLLYARMVRFVLSSLAVCSTGGSNVPPSFAEMGRSIDALIAKCYSVESDLTDGQDSSFGKEFFPLPDGEIEEEESEALSRNQQMVLSFCWHLLKMCCWSAAKLTQKFSELMEDSMIDRFLTDVVVAVLTGTRHKGAMENAQESLALMTRCLFEMKRPTSEEIIEKQLWVVLDVLDESFCSSSHHNPRRTSATRRAAGLSMLFAAICGSVTPLKQSRLVSKVIGRLVKVAQTKVEVKQDSGEVDLSPALSLHILQSMVLSSKLASATMAHLSAICILCLKNFASSLWSVRNAALQLFGAVVPRLVGQKRVKDDTAPLNSITATEFCYRNPSLTQAILDLLSECSKNYQESGLSCRPQDHETLEDLCHGKGSFSCTANEETVQTRSGGVRVDTKKNPTHPSLVPVLSLLARLNPGTGIHQNDKIKLILGSLVSKVFEFLDSSMFTVRRLASSALVSLSFTADLEAAQSLLETALDRLSLSYAWRRNNLTHGCLLFIARTVTVYPDVFKGTRIPFRERVSTCLTKLLSKTSCFVNKALIVDVLHQLQLHSPTVVIYTTDHVYRDITLPPCTKGHLGSFHPGYSSFTRSLVRNQLNHKGTENYTHLLLSDDQDTREEAFLFITQQLNCSPHHGKFSELQNSLWIFLKTQNFEMFSRNRVRMGKVFDLLVLLLDTYSMNLELCEQCFPLFEKLLVEDMNMSRYVVILVARTIVSFRVQCRQWDTLQKLAVAWARMLYKLTSPRVNEDLRLYANKALSLSLEDLFYSMLNNKEVIYPIIKASFNLLQDEEKPVRMSSSNIVRHLRGDLLVNVSSTVASMLLINRILKLYSEQRNLDALWLLWDLCFEYSLESIKINSFRDPLLRDFTKLFESTMDNAYIEPQGIADMTCARLEAIANDCCRENTDKLKFNLEDLQVFVDSKVGDLRVISDSLPNSLSPQDFINWNVPHKLTVVKNGVRFLESLKVICGANYDINLKFL